MPWRLALALQADGWYLRCDIIWQKPNPMPESVTDRPTKSHEYIFLLTKNQTYYYDAEAIKEPVTGGAHERGDGVNPKQWKTPDGWDTSNGNGGHGSFHRNGREKGKTPGKNSRIHVDRDPAHARPKPSRQNESFSAAVCGLVSTRNKRSVWTVATYSFRDAHFATFPPDLIRPCILAGTSARGCCPICGAPWRRIVERGEPDLDHQRACGGDKNGEYFGQAVKSYEGTGAQNASAVKARILAGMRERKTVDWVPTCKCPAHEPVPCVVLDPFAGSGTTLQVAREEGRSAIGIELNPQYIPLIHDRTNVTPGLAL